MFNLKKFFPFIFKKSKIGLALSGGVARGLAHIGVLKILKEYGIPINFLSGTSSGSIIGALFAAGMDPLAMENNAKKIGWFKFLKLVPARHGLLSSDEVKKFVISYIGDRKFSDLNFPFFVVACDLKSGEEVIISEGKVADAVAASCAFPGIVDSVKLNGRVLVDGGLVNNVPASVLKRNGAEFIIASDVVPYSPIEGEFKNMFQVFSRTLDIAMHGLAFEGRKSADVLIEPIITEDIGPLDIDKSPRLIKAGEIAAQNKLPEIRANIIL